MDWTGGELYEDGIRTGNWPFDDDSLLSPSAFHIVLGHSLPCPCPILTQSL
jgi:hypothetical protein